MSLDSLSQAATTADPAADLVEAMREYESVLTSEQKALLQSYDNVPRACAVIEMMTLIDEGQNNRRSHCVGVRLHPFLESVQQFSSVIDTFVSSNPTVAALVWGGVKLAMLTANKDSAYIDRVSTMLMQIRTLCPYYSQYSILYKDSARVQRVLCDYFAAVIRLCKKVVEFSQISGASRFASLLINTFEREFGPSQAALERLGRMVSEEIKLASHIAQKTQQAEDAKYRAQGYKFRDAINLERKDAQEHRHQMQLRTQRARREGLLNLLSKYPYKIAWRQARRKCIIGTCVWFKDSPEFLAWVEKGSSSVLWLSGIVGCGKTVLSAGIIAHLEASKLQDHVLAYFFCQYDDLESRQARTIVASIARQLISGCMEDSDDVSDGLESLLDHETPDIDLISENMTTMLSKSRHYHIVIDGIDECEKEERDLVFGFLKSILTDSSLTWKILCSTRPVLDEIIAKYLRPEYEIKLSGETINSDIDRFIDFSVKQKLKDHELRLGSHGLVSDIREALRQKADGMFLWVVFQIEDILAQETDAEIQEVLRNLPLPHDLPLTFRRILKRLSTARGNETQRAIKIFKWLIAAKRPLTIYELREAIAIQPYQASFEADKLSNDMVRTLSSCGSLVILDEEDHTVHFAHHSVREFILSRAKKEVEASLHLYHVSTSDAEVEASSVCLTYLNLTDFNRQVARKCYTESLPQMTAFLQAPIPSQRIPVSKIALRVLGYRRRRSGQHFNAFRALQDVAGKSANFQRWDAMTYSFLPYASKYWLDHTRQAAPDSKSRLFKQFALTLQCKSEIAELPWTVSDWNLCSRFLLKWIIDHNDVTVLRVLLTTSPRPSAKSVLEIVDLVASNGRYDLWDVLMEDSIGLRSCTSFSGDTENGKDEQVYDKVAQILSIHGSFKPPLRKGRFSLHEMRPFRIWSALRKSHCILFPTQLSELPFRGSALPGLKSLDAESRLNCKPFLEEYERRWHWISSKPWTDLDLAIAGEGISTVEALLTARKFPLLPEKSSPRAPLLLMAVLGNTDMLAYCLKNTNIERHCTTPDGFTPLMIMTAWSSEEAIVELIRAGVDVAASSSTGWNALMIAAALDFRRPADLLFEAMRLPANPSMTSNSLFGSFRATSNLVIGENQRVRVLRRGDALHNLNRWFPDRKPPPASVVPNTVSDMLKPIDGWSTQSEVAAAAEADLRKMIKDNARKSNPRYHPWHDDYIFADPDFASGV